MLIVSNWFKILSRCCITPQVLFFILGMSLALMLSLSFLVDYPRNFSLSSSPSLSSYWLNGNYFLSLILLTPRVICSSFFPQFDLIDQSCRTMGLNIKAPIPGNVCFNYYSKLFIVLRKRQVLKGLQKKLVEFIFC